MSEDTILNSIPKAVRRTGLSRSTLYRMMERGDLAYVKVGARRLIPERALNGLASDERDD